MYLLEQELEITAKAGHVGLLSYLAEAVPQLVDEGSVPVRFAITESDRRRYHCEIGLLKGLNGFERRPADSLFEFRRRVAENADAFNAVFIVPTGIGAEIGGHAGDATPVARLLSTVCDNLITHPNVVNASDINEIPENGLYVEGSVLTRLLMGTVGLQKVRSNRVLVVMDAHQDERFEAPVVNAVSAARSSYGLRCASVVKLDPPVELVGGYATSGRASGRVEGLAGLCEVLDEYDGTYDALAIVSVVAVPMELHMEYFTSGGEMVNPWGGVEAMLTHALSAMYNIPSAHAPMMESEEITYVDPGVVDPRMGAEIISLTFLQCVLKGLMRSPRIVTDQETMRSPGIITAADVSCLVIPDGCLGFPTLAALEQGIPVIAVRENRNLMRNDLTALPWAADQLHIVENYWEAVGVMAAMKAGIAPESVRRPLADTPFETRHVRNIPEESTTTSPSQEST